MDDRSITLAITSPNPTLSFGTHQTRAKEHSQQCQAGAHHNQKKEHDERVLLAHAAIRLIKPVGWSLPPGALCVAARTVPHAVLQQVSPPTHGSCPHRSGALPLLFGCLLHCLVLRLLLSELLQIQSGWPGGSVGARLGHRQEAFHSGTQHRSGNMFGRGEKWGESRPSACVYEREGGRGRDPWERRKEKREG